MLKIFRGFIKSLEFCYILRFLETFWYRESLPEISAVYLEKPPRKSHFPTLLLMDATKYTTITSDILCWYYNITGINNYKVSAAQAPHPCQLFMQLWSNNSVFHFRKLLVRIIIIIVFMSRGREGTLDYRLFGGRGHWTVNYTGGTQGFTNKFCYSLA